ncbi:hypothetical protein DEH18_00740 [Streptomyces sp. NHF165]|uniref:CU044_2847 family protein n=1 Tax=Streptomyces sp. NHF165 TaxID=2175864 RepID=UPI00132F41A1|nr:CU044_2847 family protein [Streptomyces sp. NHF165]QHF92677.1 hypothetical protein DEH18_00740 [Streptomyces sp. NHF165]
MTELISVPMEEGETSAVIFEVDSDLLGDDLDLASGQGGVIARARVSLDEALAQVRPALTRVVETVRHVAPDETEIEFGLKVGGDTTVIIAKGTAEVNFAVRLKWTKP